MPDFLPRRIRIVIKIKIMNNKAWTAAETGKLITLVAQKTPEKEIAKLLNRGRASIRGKINALSTAPEIAVAKPELPPADAPALLPDIQLKPQAFGYLPLDVTNAGEWIRFGLVSDTHLCCKEERLDVLHNAYDTFKHENISDVFHAGNIIDGYIARLNGGSVFESTIDGQAQYVVDKYPARDGITTHFISGADHENWFAEGFNIGGYISMVAKDQGRNDLNYIGHVESDVELKTGKVSTIMKIMHPGGGSAYSRSYTGQKIVESLQGGEKPAILIAGHYHVTNYMVERNIHVINLPGMQDQTIFARKKRLRMEVGFAIMEFKINPKDGAVTRCRVEFTMFWDRGYHRRFLQSDKKILHGHLVLKR
jgi:predicted phosphodiesterase